VFLLLHIVPGDPVEIMLGENALPVNKEALRAQLHLDQPLITQYGTFWKSVLHGDLGNSFVSKRPVSALVYERAPATFHLALCALVAAILIAVPLGVLSASFRDGIFDHGVLAFSMVGAAMPNFWLGPLLMLLFSVKLGWLPVTGNDGPSNYVLPSITLGLGMSCILTRMVRTTMAEVLKQDYITTARAKGLSWAPIHLKHALKNALIPTITILGLQLGGLLAGAVITETIFDWPGLGELVFRGIQSRDFPLVQGCLLVIAATYVIANTLADIAYTLANPRLEAQ
jgi:peptide/nickel transport system permease protein